MAQNFLYDRAIEQKKFVFLLSDARNTLNFTIDLQTDI